MRVVLFGATGTIGRAVLQELTSRGLRVTCVVRPGSENRLSNLAEQADIVQASLENAENLIDVFSTTPVDAVLSCLASRTGVPRDAWAIDHQANRVILSAAERAGVRQMVLVSAICVQRPKLAFQRAKLAFEAELQASRLTWSIVRPTAFFKSLSGQVKRVKAGKPFLVFGDGMLTACKPISDRDLADFVVSCLDRSDRWNRVLPVGGPGPAITPLDQAKALFQMMGSAPKIRRVPVGLLGGIGLGLGVLGKVVPRLADKAEMARIGHYYATESMLLWDETAGAYSADATPSHGTETLFDFYARLLAGDASVDLGNHAVF